MIKKIPSLVAAVVVGVAAGAVGFAVFYNWGYFQVLDANLFSLLTFSDHIASTLNLAPIFAFSFLFGVFFNISRRKPDGNGPPLAVLFQTENFQFGFKKIRFYELLGLFLIWLILFFLLPIIHYVLLIFFSLWVWRFLFFHISNALQPLQLKELLPVIYIVPVLSLFAILLGLVNGEADLIRKKGDTRIELKNNAIFEEAILLRSMGSFYMVRLPSKQEIVMIPIDSIRSMQKRREFSTNSIGCDWLGLCLFNN